MTVAELVQHPPGGDWRTPQAAGGQRVEELPPAKPRVEARKLGRIQVKLEALEDSKSSLKLWKYTSQTRSLEESKSSSKFGRIQVKLGEPESGSKLGFNASQT